MPQSLPNTQTLPEGLPDDFIGERYVVEELIGSGGFGSVYRATDTKIGGTVALKLLDASRANAPKSVARFRQEVRLLRALRHPNTVRVFDADVDEALGAFYFSMELLEGHSLSEALIKDGPMPVGRVIALASQMLASLAEAHEAGMVHRDIKPANLFLCDYERAPNHLKVLDFGVAKPRTSTIDLTDTGALLCTPRYSAPELLGPGHPGPSADVYSVGLVLWELLTGVPAVKGETVAELIVQQCSDEEHQLPAQLRDTPLGTVVGRAIRKRPAERYADAAEMWQAIEDLQKSDSSAAIGGESPVAAGAVERPQRPLRFPAMVVGALSVVGLLAASALPARHEPPLGSVGVSSDFEAAPSSAATEPLRVAAVSEGVRRGSEVRSTAVAVSEDARAPLPTSSAGEDTPPEPRAAESRPREATQRAPVVQPVSHEADPTEDRGPAPPELLAESASAEESREEDDPSANRRGADVPAPSDGLLPPGIAPHGSPLGAEQDGGPERAHREAPMNPFGFQGDY